MVQLREGVAATVWVVNIPNENASVQLSADLGTTESKA